MWFITRLIVTDSNWKLPNTSKTAALIQCICTWMFIVYNTLIDNFDLKKLKHFWSRAFLLGILNIDLLGLGLGLGLGLLLLLFPNWNMQNSWKQTLPLINPEKQKKPCYMELGSWWFQLDKISTNFGMWTFTYLL